MEETTAIMKYEGTPFYSTSYYKGKKWKVYKGYEKTLRQLYQDGMCWIVNLFVIKSGKTYINCSKRDQYAATLRYYLRKHGIDIPRGWGTREQLKALIKKYDIKCSLITPAQKEWFIENIARGRSMISDKPIKRGDIHHLRYGYDETEDWWRHVIYCTHAEHEKIHGRHKSGEIIKVDISKISDYWREYEK